MLTLAWRNLWRHKTRTWLLVVALAGLLSLLIPARRVLKLKPVEAMRHVA